ncbi:MFS transporter [Brevibacterium sp. CBA3109]|uniref:MFS transporter n=1 Tax=Brevibacterium koreense TaxID=3140787 RepID=A0AAU7UJ96_9MICO
MVGTDGVDAGRWRLPFLLTLPLGGAALWLRMKLDEPEAFSKATTQQQKNRQPFGKPSTGFKKHIVILIALVVLLNIGQHVALTYWPTDFAETLGHSQIENKLMLVALLLAMIIVVSPLGWLTDTIERKPFLYTSTTGFAVLSVPAFMLMQAEARDLQFLGLGIIALLQVMMQSCVSATLPAIFRSQVHFLGFAIDYDASTAIFGETTAAINTFVVKSTDSEPSPAVYLMGARIGWARRNPFLQRDHWMSDVSLRESRSQWPRRDG